MAEHILNYDEDDPGMVELLPFANWQHVTSLLQRKHGDEESKKVSKWFSWFKKDVHPEPLELANLGINKQSLIEVLSTCSQRFDRLECYGIGDVEEMFGLSCVAFGSQSHSGVVADIGDDETVKQLWCAGPFAEGDMRAMLVALGRAFPLLLVDWRSEEMLDLSDSHQIDAYLDGT